MATSIATLAGGCFWCLESVFNRMRGIHSAISGYMGGATPDPTYKDICRGDTGHAEVVQLTFDPAEMAYSDVLEIFFALHDPTQKNRQGNDVGTQYRSAIFYHSAEQRAEAMATIAALETGKVFSEPIVTEVVAASVFYPAEEYHQGYFDNNSGQSYCQFVVAPKIAKARAKFGSRMKS